MFEKHNFTFCQTYALCLSVSVFTLFRYFVPPAMALSEREHLGFPVSDRCRISTHWLVSFLRRKQTSNEFEHMLRSHTSWGKGGIYWFKYKEFSILTHGIYTWWWNFHDQKLTYGAGVVVHKLSCYVGRLHPLEGFNSCLCFQVSFPLMRLRQRDGEMRMAQELEFLPFIWLLPHQALAVASIWEKNH